MISSDRMAHQLGVARRLVEQARLRGVCSEEEVHELFVIGYLHDIGYEFANDPDDHAEVGGEILKRLGFKYWAEVANHGKPVCIYVSSELDMLNAADMHTMPDGSYASFDDRLHDIGERYGESSPRYKNARTLIADLKRKGFE